MTEQEFFHLSVILLIITIAENEVALLMIVGMKGPRGLGMKRDLVDIRLYSLCWLEEGRKMCTVRMKECVGMTKCIIVPCLDVLRVQM